MNQSNRIIYNAIDNNLFLNDKNLDKTENKIKSNDNSIQIFKRNS